MAAMKSSYEFHNFPKLAEESGFAFSPLRPRVFVDWTRIRSIDIESLIRERKFYLIEQHISDILSCALESEFDVRILDQGVIKMFRLAQLAVEYQQFCRQYLDRSINVLREEITALMQELENCRKELRGRDEELKRLRKKTKHTYRPPIPYGNDNIATMILKTLTNKSDVFPSTSNADTRAYNRCNYCDKVFLNQLYLKSHIARRHPGMLDINVPEKENPITVENANSSTEIVDAKLSEEIMQLKSKLGEMEIMIANTRMHGQNAEEIKSDVRMHSENSKEDAWPAAEKSDNVIVKKNTKDAEVSTSTEDYLLDKIEEWKKEEYEKYNKELKVLRTQILETINYMKERGPQSELPKESESIDHLHVIIKQQGEELHALKQELETSKLIQGNEDLERRKEAEAQMMFLAQRTEMQAKQYEALLQKLNEVAKEAKESRTLAEAERERATQLQELLHNHLNNKQSAKEPIKHEEYQKKSVMNGIRNSSNQNYLKTDRKSLESLHRKAQELLNIDTSSSSDISTANSEKGMKPTTQKVKETSQTKELKNKKSFNDIKVANYTKNSRKKNMERVAESEHINNGNIDKHAEKFRNGSHGKPGSPVKVVRAKITEEVNNRLVTFGVDPLNNSLPKNVFKRHRIKLQLQHDTKAKKNPAYLKVKHKILTYLDLNTSALKESSSELQEYVSPSKASKAFSISSVLSNVKSKALALVQTNESKARPKSDAFKGRHKKVEITRKYISTKSPTESESSSPQVQRRNVSAKVTNTVNVRRRHASEPSLIEGTNKLSQMTNASNNDDEKSSDSDHKYSAVTEPTTKSVESLVKSPARRPSSANAVYDNKVRKFTIVNKDSPIKESNVKQGNYTNSVDSIFNNDMNDDDVDSSIEAMLKKAVSVDNVQAIPKQTKGVLKYASSASSLNKKKVLFDMEAIQMKSVSASPSQSINEKSDDNEKFELGLINLEGEDWDISSIENEPLNNDTKIKLDSRTSPKIAELRQSIESQLARRKEGNTNLVGAVDVMKGPLIKVPSVTGAGTGSNTSLGSSILDESDVPPAVKTNAYVKAKRASEINDSDLDISEYSIEAMVSSKNKKKEESF